MSLPMFIQEVDSLGFTTVSTMFLIFTLNRSSLLRFDSSKEFLLYTFPTSHKAVCLKTSPSSPFPLSKTRIVYPLHLDLNPFIKERVAGRFNRDLLDLLFEGTHPLVFPYSSLKKIRPLSPIGSLSRLSYVLY